MCDSTRDRRTVLAPAASEPNGAWHRLFRNNTARLIHKADMRLICRPFPLILAAFATIGMLSASTLDFVAQVWAFANLRRLLGVPDVW